MTVSMQGLKRGSFDLISGGLGDDMGRELSRKIVVFNAFSLIGIFNLLLLGTLAYFQKTYWLAALDYCAGFALGFMIIYLRRTNDYKSAFYGGVGVVGALYYYLLFTGGVNNTAHVWCFTFPLIASFVLGSRPGLVATFLLLLPAVVFFMWENPPSPFTTYSWDFKVRFIPSFLVVTAFAYFFERTREKATTRLEGVNGELKRTVSVLKETEEKLRRAGEALEQQVEERTAQLYRTNLQLAGEMEERKLFENALMESEKKYRTLFEESVEAMSVSRAGRMIDVNPAWLTLHGYTDKESILGRNVMEFILPEDRHILAERRKKWPHHGHRSYQIRDVRRDGGIVDIEICASRITLTGQEAILTTLRDITEKMRSELEKKALEERLVRSEKMEAIGTLAGGVAHDLNNILGGIVGYPDLLLMDLPEESPLRRGLVTIKTSGEKAAAIVQDLLTLARRGVPVMEPVGLNRITSDYIGSPEFEKLCFFHAGVRIESDLAPDLLPIQGSPVHLSKVVMNLVSNAAEAMPHGGTIRIETYNHYVDKATRGYEPVSEGEYIVLKVSDTGVGIPQEDLKKIFEPFYTKKVMGRSGTGLGMAVVWGTVKDHKGYIDIESVEGQGTTFTLYFPANHAAIKPEDRKVSIDQYLSKGEAILVVDDVPEQRELASAMLEKLGYRTETIESGEKAVEYLKKKPASLVVLDMVMEPGIDGLETYRRIREHRPEQKAIIVSGFAETARVKEAQKLGAGPYLKKPYTLEKIAVAVRQELERTA
jgi:PAS domain S-box-containing protein